MILARAAAAIFAGFVVFVLLVPTSGAEPPLCFALPGYQVPCGGEVAQGAGAATAVVVGLVLWLVSRRRATS